MKKHFLLGAILATFGFTMSASAAEQCHIAWSHYTGWEPAGYIQDTGIAKKWGDKYGVDFKFVYIGDYIESVNQYAAGQFQGVTVTNMDGLTIPATGGIDTTVLIVGDFSNGNDGILMNCPAGNCSLSSLKGKTIKLVELSVSHYALARALDSVGLSERDIKVVNTSDADLPGLIASSQPGDAFVTWNPILMGGRNVANMQLLWDSSQIPGEIIDAVMVGTGVSDACKSAVTGAWYEGVSKMAASDKEALAFMADQAGGTLAEFMAQLKTTRMFYDPAEGAAFAGSDQVKATMAEVARFSFDHGLYGDGAPDERFVGIQYPDGTVWGDPNFVKLRFDDAFMKKAAAGEL